MITVNIREIEANNAGLAPGDIAFVGDVDGREIAGNTYAHAGKIYLNVAEYDEAGNFSNVHSCNVEVENTIAGIKAAIEAHYDDVIELIFDFDTTAI